MRRCTPTANFLALLAVVMAGCESASQDDDGADGAIEVADGGNGALDVGNIVSDGGPETLDGGNEVLDGGHVALVCTAPLASQKQARRSSSLVAMPRGVKRREQPSQRRPIIQTSSSCRATSHLSVASTNWSQMFQRTQTPSMSS